MTNRYHIIVDTGDHTYNCNAKTMRSAKCKITRFKNQFPHKIISAEIYENHNLIFTAEINKEK